METLEKRGAAASHRGMSPSILAAAALVVVAVLLYYPCLRGSFIYFDAFEIQGNPAVTNSALWAQNFTHSARSALAGRGYYYRPFYFLSYWLVYRFAGPQPLAFHLLQLLLFAGTALLLFRVGFALLRDRTVAFAGAILWTLHPAHVEAVAWISSLCDVGCTLFYFLAFWLFLRAEAVEPKTMRRHLPAAIAFLGALFFKEMAFSFLLLLLAYGFFFGTRESWRTRTARWLPYVLVFCAYLLIRISVLGRVTVGGSPWNISRSLVMRSLILLGEHTRIFFWPAHLTYGCTTGLEGGSLFPWPLLTLAGLGLIFANRKRWPALGFLSFWWPLTLAPALDIRQITFPYAADRFSYLPSAGLCLAISYFLFHLVPRRFPTLRPSRFAVPVTAAVSLVWCLEASRTIPQWHSEEAFSTFSIQQSPRVPIFHFIRAKVLATQSGDLEGAVGELETTLRLSESAPEVWAAVAHDAYMGLANIAVRKGRLGEAVNLYEQAAAKMPANSLAYREIASLYFRQENFPKMAEYLSEVVRRDPLDLEAQFNLGVCWLKMRKYSDAARQFRVVASLDPDFPHIGEAEAQSDVSGRNNK